MHCLRGVLYAPNAARVYPSTSTTRRPDAVRSAAPSPSNSLPAPSRSHASLACPGRPLAAPLRAAATTGALNGSSLRVGIVVARFNEIVTRTLLEGALDSLGRYGVDVETDVHVAWVPGSFELPVVAKSMAKSGKFDAVITIGTVVRSQRRMAGCERFNKGSFVPFSMPNRFPLSSFQIKGATAHYDAVVGAATAGIVGASTDSGTPVIFCVLTCETLEQGLARAGGHVGNKGSEAAVTAVEMGTLMKQLRLQGLAAKPW